MTPTPETPMPKTVDGFFVILRDDDYRLHRHDDSSAAAREAKRLAEVAPGHRFYVLCSTHAYSVPERVIVEECETAIPF